MILPRLLAVAVCSAAVWLGAAAGCSASTPTEIVLQIESDLTIPDEIDGLALKVEYWGALRFDSNYDLDPAKPGFVELPTTVGLVAGDSPLQEVSIDAMATKEGQLVVRHRCRVPFVEERIIALPVRLQRACVGVRCNESQTCRHGTCSPMKEDPSRLSDYDGP